MSDQPQNPYQQQYGHGSFNAVPPQPPQAPVLPPQKPSKLKRFGLPIGLLLLGLVIGGASGASAVPEPVEIVKEVPVEKIVTKTVKETPATCLTAIGYAEDIIASTGRVVGVFGQILDAASDLNAARIEALNPEIDVETEVINELRPKYQSARDDCQASR